MRTSGLSWGWKCWRGRSVLSHPWPTKRKKERMLLLMETWRPRGNSLKSQTAFCPGTGPRTEVKSQGRLLRYGCLNLCISKIYDVPFTYSKVSFFPKQPYIPTADVMQKGQIHMHALVSGPPAVWSDVTPLAQLVTPQGKELRSHLKSLRPYPCKGLYHGGMSWGNVSSSLWQMHWKGPSVKQGGAVLSPTSYGGC